MWIRFNLEEMIFELKIENYEPNQTVNGSWTKVSFNFKFENIINYSTENNEILLCCEIDELRDKFFNLLNDKLTEKVYYSCLEPDFEFILRPKFDVRNNPNLIYVKPGNEIIDIDMELRVNLWNNGLTCNYFSTSFYREEINNLYLYFSLISNKISLNDEKIKKLIDLGIIYRDTK